MSTYLVNLKPTILYLILKKFFVMIDLLDFLKIIIRFYLFFNHSDYYSINNSADINISFIDNFSKGD